MVSRNSDQPWEFSCYLLQLGLEVDAFPTPAGHPGKNTLKPQHLIRGPEQQEYVRVEKQSGDAKLLRLNSEAALRSAAALAGYRVPYQSMMMGWLWSTEEASAASRASMLWISPISTGTDTSQK